MSEIDPEGSSAFVENGEPQAVGLFPAESATPLILTVGFVVVALILAIVATRDPGENKDLGWIAFGAIICALLSGLWFRKSMEPESPSMTIDKTLDENRYLRM